MISKKKNIPRFVIPERNLIRKMLLNPTLPGMFLAKFQTANMSVKGLEEYINPLWGYFSETFRNQKSSETWNFSLSFRNQKPSET